MVMTRRERDQDGDEGPPFFRRWTGCYVFVVLHLLLWILLFYWLTRWWGG
ncbi:MAG: hypothetical protein NZ742_09535 [Acidobacteria bacterium]|nr:hypothetical protein [Acidobacteriota bacterium]MDW7984226.1 hypothetical protein [Acidobacteriota bacterium]